MYTRFRLPGRRFTIARAFFQVASIATIWTSHTIKQMNPRDVCGKFQFKAGMRYVPFDVRASRSEV
jgi:hypothetical protein